MPVKLQTPEIAHTAMVPLAEMGLDAPPEVGKECADTNNLVYDGEYIAHLSHYVLQADPPCNMAQVQERIRSFEAAQQKQPPITYLHLFEDQEMSMGIFCLPAGATIPLHDHPGMTVFSRVLYGQLFIQAFDWVSAHAPSSPSHGGSHSAASSGTGTDEDASCVDESRPAKLVVARVQVNDGGGFVVIVWARVVYCYMFTLPWQHTMTTPLTPLPGHQRPTSSTLPPA